MKFRIPKIPYWPLLLGPAIVEKLGAYSNHFAMMANGGQMPVLFPGGCPAPDPDEVPDILHVCMTSATHLKVLCDIIVSHSGISSIGDVLIDAADFCFWPAVIIWGTLMIYDKILLDKSRGL